MNVLVNKKVGCGGGFFYKCPECGWTKSSRDYDQILKTVVDHRLANNHPVGLNWEKLFQHQMCEHFAVMHPDKDCCRDENWNPVHTQPPPFSRQIVSAFTDFSTWIRNGMKQTEIELAQKRYEICKDCEHWNGMEFFGLGRCRKCGCCTKLKISMDTTKCPIGKW